jgi:hypothetical protein
MNALDRLLQDDLNRLLDRVAAAAHEGMATRARERPDLAARIDRAEERLSLLRQSLLGGYEEWREALQECEDLWALADLRTTDPVEHPASRAA